MNEKMQLGEMLIKLKLLTRETWNAAVESLKEDELSHLQENGDLLMAEVLLKHHDVSEHQLMPVLEYIMGVSYMDIKKCEINQLAIKLIPEAIAKKYQIIPIAICEDKLQIIMADPLDLIAQTDARIISNYELEVYFAFRSDIMTAIAANYVTSEMAEQAMEEIGELDEDTNQEELDDEVARAPIVRLVNSIFGQAVKMGASDIHIEPMEKMVKVRFRKDGDLKEIMTVPKSSMSAMISRVKIMSGLDIAEKRVPQDGRFGLAMSGRAVDFRVSVLPIIHGEKVVIRILDRNEILVSRSRLGFSSYNSKLFDKLLKVPEGIILLSGPTGSGKTTTLYAVLRELNHPNVNIVTVEDPVEYHLDGIHQVQVNAKAGLGFASGLRAILRQDPDIIMVGEIRDTQTADIATKASITGHIVLSTIHTNDTASTVSRLSDMGIELYMIASALRGVVAQRLVKRLCPNCRHEKETTPEEMVMLKIDRPIKIYEPVGCNICSGTGYSGRIAVHEILIMDRDIRSMVTSGESIEAIKERAIEKGMQTLSDSCRSLIIDGITSVAELNRVAYSVDE